MTHRHHHHKLRREHSDDTVGLTTDGWDTEKTQNILNGYLDAMSPEARVQQGLPSHITEDGLASNGGLGSVEATPTETFNTLDAFVHSALDRAQPGAYVPANLGSAKASPSERLWEHGQSKALVANMQRLMGFVDPAKYHLTAEDIKEARHDNTAAALAKIEGVFGKNSDAATAALQQVAAGHIIDGQFGPISKTAWKTYINNPQMAVFAKSLGHDVPAPSAPAAPATEAQLAATISAPVEDNRNGTFWVTVPNGRDPHKYYEGFRETMGKCGAHDVGHGEQEKIGTLWADQTGHGGSGFFVGEKVFNQPGVMDNMAAHKSDFAALGKPAPSTAPAPSAGGKKSPSLQQLTAASSIPLGF